MITHSVNGEEKGSGGGAKIQQANERMDFYESTWLMLFINHFVLEKKKAKKNVKISRREISRREISPSRAFVKKERKEERKKKNFFCVLFNRRSHAPSGKSLNYLFNRE